MLNVYEIINNNITSSLAYLVYSCDIWNIKFRYVNLSYIKKMVDLSLIPKFFIKNQGKCESCMESITTEILQISTKRIRTTKFNSK